MRAAARQVQPQLAAVALAPAAVDVPNGGEHAPREVLRIRVLAVEATALVRIRVRVRVRVRVP